MSDDFVSKILDEDFLDDSQCSEGDLLSAHTGSCIVHSPTTDTLDSVALGPSEDYSLLDDTTDSNLDEVNEEKTDDGGIEVVISTTEEEAPASEQSQVEKQENVSNVELDTTTNTEPVNISSYFTSNGDQDSDPFGSLVKTGDQQSEQYDFIQGIEEEIQHELLEKRTSVEEPAQSVEFEAVPEHDENVMEASMQIIDDKEDFESFTAESGPTDIGNDFNNLVTDKIADMHLTDTPSLNGSTDHRPLEYARQLSVSSQQGAPPTPPVIPSPIHQPFSGGPFSASHISPFGTPSNQPSLPTQVSGIQQPEMSTSQVASDTSQNPNTPVYSSLDTENSATNTFRSGPNLDLNDPFTASLQMSDSDRQHDAWIPSDVTRQVLVTMATSVPGTYIPVPEEMSKPGIIVDEPQGDPVRDLVYRYMGEQEAIKRQILSVDSVTQDVEGLKELIKGGCYRSAVDMCRRLLTSAGQGPGKAGQVTQHTIHTIQLWFCRLTLLIKLRLYSIAESEMIAFQNLDTPDLYFEFYPHIYPGRKGSMVPFGMRLLHAEIPHYMGRSQETLDRLYYMLAVTQKILKNLEDGYAEDGSTVQLTEDSRKGSLEIWQERERQVLYVIGNTFLAIRDYEAAMTMYNLLLTKDPTRKGALLSGMGRIYLQMGNVDKAKECFQHAEVISESGDRSIQCRNAINRGLEAMCLNNFSDAYQNFKQAVEAEPTNTSAVNNMAACSLYLGKLMDALKTLEVLVHEDPARNLNEGVLFNLCTLYELESSRALHKKQALLDLVSRHKGDGFPAACLKMA